MNTPQTAKSLDRHDSGRSEEIRTKESAGFDEKIMVSRTPLMVHLDRHKIIYIVAQFAGNPHIVIATTKDFTLPAPSAKSTFPEPLPSYLPRTVKVPIAIVPTRDSVSANAGRFSLSMKGMRKELRRARGRTETLVRIVEAEMMEWLQGGVMLLPNQSNAAGLPDLQITSDDQGRAIESTGIVELSRSPLQLIWSVADDAFARYVVHCCARYHQVISFSGLILYLALNNE